MWIKYPFEVSDKGQTAQVSNAAHVRQLIEQILFTQPGERVNRPDFGSALNQLVFAPASNELSTTYQFLVQGALQQWLGDLIQVNEVQIATEDSTLTVTIRYQLYQTQEQRVEQFSNVLLSPLL